MSGIAGYSLGDRIYDGTKTVVYRGRQDKDNQPVVIKVLKAEFPTLTETTRLKQEYKLLKKLPIYGVIQAYDLVSYQNRLALILEDIGGVSLKQFCREYQLSLPEFLQIAIQIATTLAELHQSNIIHKDIKPKNIIINPQTRQVKITDFGIATRLSKENPALTNPNVLEGTLAYISPEQTGRMNRVIDYRTDLYSLGVTLYELLAGNLPFLATDSLELIHCHIAKGATPIHLLAKLNITNGESLNTASVQVVSDIVMKLLAKNAEDRYQSAYGLKVDLEKCLQMLETKENILTFPLGQQDLLGKLLIPQKLYGRETEVEQLM